MSTIDYYQTIGLFIQFAGFISVIIIFIRQNRNDKKLLKREIYQRLEFASIDLFRFELENSEITWRLYDENYQIPQKTTKEYHDLVNHITQIVNLFEMIVQFRKEKIIKKEIFSTWVTWFWEISQLKIFMLIWPTLKINYTSDLQELINIGISSNGNWNKYVNEISGKYKSQKIAELTRV